MTLFKRLLINLLAPPAVMAVIHAIWKVEIVADLPTAWAVVYLFALLLPAWLIAEAFNQLMLRIGSFRATPSYLRYFVAAIPIPFLSLLWARDVRAIVVGLTPNHIINNAYLRGGSVCLNSDWQRISGLSAGCFLKMPMWVSCREGVARPE